MRVVVVNAYNRHNGGDAALLSAAIAQIRMADPAAEIAYAGLEDPRDFAEFEGATNLGSIRRWAGDQAVSPLRRWSRKATAFAIAAMPRKLTAGLLALADRYCAGSEPVAELRAIADAHLVIGLGGGYFNGSANLAGTLNVAFLSVPLLLAGRLGRPVLLAPQSYGPFGNRFQRALVRRALNASARVEVREDTSLALLRGMGVDDRLLARGVDSAFATIGPGPGARRPVSVRPVVGITARSWLAGDAQERYEREIARFVDWLDGERGAVVRLIPQVTSTYRGDDDRSVSRRIADWCSSTPEVIEDQLHHAALRASYAALDYLVGTRFHSVIFSLTSGVPAVAIEYEHKTSGIMTDLGLGEWVVPITAVTAEVLIERFTALERCRPEYLARLDEALPEYRARADAFVGIVRGSVA